MAIASETAFASLTERHRRELHVHCYRMLASFEEAEDAVQETYLRAWRSRDTFDGSRLLRAWLYRIATNVCLDMIRARSRRPATGGSFAEMSWLQPYPDRLLDEVAPSADQPDAVAVERETIELAFLAAMQLLPPRQRAALILRDVLDLPAAETASMLDTSVAAANSALQRARATMQSHLPAHRAEWPATTPSAEERDLLDRFIDAHQRFDTAAALAISAQDIRVTMPPDGLRFDGIDAVAPLMAYAFRPNGDGDWRLVPTMANRMPTAACYLRRRVTAPSAHSSWTCSGWQTGRSPRSPTFGRVLFPHFGLPEVLAD